jgi:hypothetical protein
MRRAAGIIMGWASLSIIATGLTIAGVTCARAADIAVPGVAPFAFAVRQPVGTDGRLDLGAIRIGLEGTADRAEPTTVSVRLSAGTAPSGRLVPDFSCNMGNIGMGRAEILEGTGSCSSDKVSIAPRVPKGTPILVRLVASAQPERTAAVDTIVRRLPRGAAPDCVGLAPKPGMRADGVRAAVFAPTDKAPAGYVDTASMCLALAASTRPVGGVEAYVSIGQLDGKGAMKIISRFNCVFGDLAPGQPRSMSLNSCNKTAGIDPLPLKGPLVARVSLDATPTATTLDQSPPVPLAIRTR